MASRRQLKKEISNRICSIVYHYCAIEACTENERTPEQLGEIVTSLFGLHDELIARISHTEPGNAKAFYKKLKADFHNEIARLLPELKA